MLCYRVQKQKIRISHPTDECLAKGSILEIDHPADKGQAMDSTLWMARFSKQQKFWLSKSQHHRKGRCLSPPVDVEVARSSAPDYLHSSVAYS